MLARLAETALFDQIGKRLVDQGLNLPAFILGDALHGVEQLGGNLGCEFLFGLLGHCISVS